MKKYVALFVFLFIASTYQAINSNDVLTGVFIEITETTKDELTEMYSLPGFSTERPNPLLQLFKKRHKKNAKVVAMILAFPFPFGLVGLHRIYLGCAPYVPVVYIASLGGGFGILPLIDFIVLAASRDLDSFINNQKVFMWVK